MFCTYCASTIEPGAKVCGQCGREVVQEFAQAAPPVPPIEPTPAPLGRPGTVTAAVVLLSLGLLFGLLSLASIAVARSNSLGASAGGLTFVLMRSLLVTILWFVCLIFVWMRQGWARFAIVLLLGWGAITMAGNLIRFMTAGDLGPSILFSMAMPLLLLFVRIAAVALLFTPSANAWFGRK